MPAVPADKHFHDIGPDPDMDLELGEPVEFAPDFHLSLVVSFSDQELAGIDAYAEEHGINAVRAVQRLVAEALAAHARR